MGHSCLQSLVSLIIVNRTIFEKDDMPTAFKKGINTYQFAEDYNTISEALDVSNSVRCVLLKMRPFAIILSFHLIKITVQVEHKMAKDNLWICRSISSWLKFMIRFQKNFRIEMGFVEE